jgi:hypothetical protein
VTVLLLLLLLILIDVMMQVSLPIIVPPHLTYQRRHCRKSVGAIGHMDCAAGDV